MLVRVLLDDALHDVARQLEVHRVLQLHALQLLVLAALLGMAARKVHFAAAAQFSRGAAIRSLTSQKVPRRFVWLRWHICVVEGVEHQVHVLLSVGLNIGALEVLFVFVYCNLDAALGDVGGRAAALLLHLGCAEVVLSAVD